MPQLGQKFIVNSFVQRGAQNYRSVFQVGRGISGRQFALRRVPVIQDGDSEKPGCPEIRVMDDLEKARYNLRT